MAASEKEIDVFLLDDTPASHGTDAEPRFDAHESIATTFQRLIQKQRGGKFVALEGGWGSGKTTVIKLLLAKLTNSPDHRVAVIAFDAWAHTGDFLRRTFLETAITQLSQQQPSWLNVDHWKDVADQLGKKIKRTSTISRPSISKSAIVVGILVLLMPLGSSLLTSAIQKSNDAKPTSFSGTLEGSITTSGSQDILRERLHKAASDPDYKEAAADIGRAIDALSSS